jgi:hypothetical protein
MVGVPLPLNIAVSNDSGDYYSFANFGRFNWEMQQRRVNPVRGGPVKNAVADFIRA